MKLKSTFLNYEFEIRELETTDHEGNDHEITVLSKDNHKIRFNFQSVRVQKRKLWKELKPDQFFGHFLDDYFIGHAFQEIKRQSPDNLHQEIDNLYFLINTGMLNILTHGSKNK